MEIEWQEIEEWAIYGCIQEVPRCELSDKYQIADQMYAEFRTWA